MTQPRPNNDDDSKSDPNSGSFFQQLTSQTAPTTQAPSSPSSSSSSSFTNPRSNNTRTILRTDIENFLPIDIPQVYPDGRIPLRYQIYNDKNVLRTVLTKPKKGVYMCNHCDNMFANFGDLLDHFDVFQIKRQYKCTHEDCPWKIVGFNRLRQLQRHQVSVHNTNKEHICNVQDCNKRFARMDLLNRHLKTVHQNKKSRFNKKLTKSASATPVSSVQSSISSAPTSRENSPPVSVKPFSQHPGDAKQQEQQPPLQHEQEQQEQEQQNQQPQSQPTAASSSSSSPTTTTTFNPKSPEDLTKSPSTTQSNNSKYTDNYYKHTINFLTNKE